MNKTNNSNEFESYDVEFKIVSNRNEEVYVEGYVTINDAEAEDVDWYYYDAQGMATSQMFVEHDGVDGFKGATDKQKWEVEQFRVDYGEDAFWIDEVILQSDDDENKTHVRENLTLIINEGAKMECELIHTPNKFLGFNQYFCEIIPRFNGEKINLAGFMEENNLILDPYGCQDDSKFAIEGSHIYCELSADYFEDGEIEYNEKVVNKDVEYIYKQYLTSELGVYGIASVIYQEKHGKLDESSCDKFANNWEQGFESEDVVELYSLTSEDVERIIKEELEEDNY